MTLALRYRPIPDSPLARWDARWKLAGLSLAGGGIAALDQVAASVVALAACLCLLMLARLPGRWLRGRLGLFLLAASPFLLILPFTSEHGLETGCAVACRCAAIGSLSLILIGTAPLHQTLAAAHRLRIPGLLVLLTSLAYRYSFLLGDELRRLRVAARVRGFRPAFSWHGYRTLGHMTGAVLVHGADRADHVAAAMSSRGFDGRFHTLSEFRTNSRDVLSFIAIATATIALVIWDHL
jgi:cobalt/nickel transport system permease protein